MHIYEYDCESTGTSLVYYDTILTSKTEFTLYSKLLATLQLKYVRTYVCVLLAILWIVAYLMLACCPAQ